MKYVNYRSNGGTFLLLPDGVMLLKPRKGVGAGGFQSHGSGVVVLLSA